MAEQILDGKGRGYQVEVTENNRLVTSARTANRIFYNSRDTKKSFTINLSLEHSAGGNVSESLGFIRYIGNDYLYLKEIIVNTEEASGVTAVSKFGFWLSPSTAEGGTTKTATNLNQTSSLDSDTECIHQNNGFSGVTISGGGSVGTVRLGGIGTEKFDMRGSLILGKNGVFGIKAACQTSGTSMRATLVWYEEKII